MSERSIVVVRWLLLAAAVTSLLQATLLFNFFQRRLINPWLALNERQGARVPALMRDPRMQRGWPLLTAILFGTLWWFLGTQAAHDWLQAPGRQG